MGSLRFAGDLSPMVTVALIVFAALAVMWFYLRETKGLDAPYRYLIPALRATATPAHCSVVERTLTSRSGQTTWR